jgi:excisionase family DNA binding protein
MEIHIPELKEISDKLTQLLIFFETHESPDKSKPEKTIVINKDKSKYFNVDSLAKYLNLSRATIYKWTCSRIIPFFKVGSRTMFKKEDIEEWIDKKRIKPISE